MKRAWVVTSLVVCGIAAGSGWDAFAQAGVDAAFSQPLLDPSDYHDAVGELGGERDAALNAILLDLGALITLGGAFLARRLRRPIYEFGTLGEHEAPNAARRLAVRRRLVRIGWVILSVSIMILLAQVASGTFFQSFGARQIMVGMAIIFSISTIRHESARISTVETNGAEADPGPALRRLAPDILYLRSFGDDGRGSEPVGLIPSDSSLERQLLRDLRKTHAVAVIRNAELPPLPGVVSLETDPQSWQGAVLSLLGTARCIFILVATSPSLRWEIEQVVAGGHLEKAVLILPPLSGIQAATLLRTVVIPALPPNPAGLKAMLSEVEALDLTLQPAAIVFDGWAPRLIRPCAMATDPYADLAVRAASDRLR